MELLTKQIFGVINQEAVMLSEESSVKYHIKGQLPGGTGTVTWCHLFLSHGGNQLCRESTKSSPKLGTFMISDFD